MAQENTAEPILFERFTDGGQLFLSDGSVFRAGMKFLNAIARWEAGVPVSVEIVPTNVHDRRITNLDTGEAINATPSSNLSKTPFGA